MARGVNNPTNFFYKHKENPGFLWIIGSERKENFDNAWICEISPGGILLYTGNRADDAVEIKKAASAGKTPFVIPHI